MKVPTATSYKTDKLEMLSYPETYRKDFEWIELEPFTAVMRVVDYSRGRSSVTFTLVDQATGHMFHMFPVDAIEMIKTCDLHNGETANVWEPCKRGANYGIRIKK
jgi:hypothetical protein